MYKDLYVQSLDRDVQRFMFVYKELYVLEGCTKMYVFVYKELCLEVCAKIYVYVQIYMFWSTPLEKGMQGSGPKGLS